MSSLLGVPDEKVGARTTDFTTNKIGGLPDWIIPGSKIPSCQSCSRVMSLAAQLYCPLDGSPYHRTLYLFSCHNKVCWGKSESWTALRSQKLDESFADKAEKAEKLKPSATFEDWGVAADDWGVDADDWENEVDDCKSESANSITENTLSETEIKGQRSDISRGHDRGTNWRDVLVESGAGRDECLSEMSNYTSQSQGEVLLTGDSDLHGEMAQLSVHDFEDNESDKSDSNIVMDTDSISLKVTEEGIKEMMNLLASKSQGQIFKGQGQSSSSQSQNSSSDYCHENDPRLVSESYYISVFNEPEAVEENNSHVQELLRDYKLKEGGDLDSPAEGKKGIKGGAETYEEDQVVHGDKYFYKFSKRIAVCPQQCVRYHWNGNPLYISRPGPNLTSTLICNHCRGQAVYELQLLPALVNFLRVNDKSDPATEFGTVILYSCRGSCWMETDITRTEVTVVQPDPDFNLFR